MKRYLAVLVFGLVLGCTVAYGSGGMIGKTVDNTYPVYLEGEKAPMEAIVIEGVSYLPTRYIAESAGYEVAFEADQIYLSGPATEVTIEKMPEDYLRVGNVHFVGLDIPDQAVAIQLLNGEFYLKKSAFGKYLNIYKQTIEINGHALNVKDPTIMVKLSDLGLTGTMDGDTLNVQ